METEASLVRLRRTPSRVAVVTVLAFPLAKSSLMPDAAGETVASGETGAVGRVAVADLGNGYILRPYGEDALRRAEVTCSCVKTVDSSRGECGEGAE